MKNDEQGPMENLLDGLDQHADVLSSDQLKRLDGISKIEMGFPYDFLSSDMVKILLYGNTYPFIDYQDRGS